MSALGPAALLAASLHMNLLKTQNAFHPECYSQGFPGAFRRCSSKPGIAFSGTGLFICDLFVTFGIENKAASCTAWMGRADVDVPCGVGLSCSVEKTVAAWVPSTPGDVGPMSLPWNGSWGPYLVLVEP